MEIERSKDQHLGTMLPTQEGEKSLASDQRTAAQASLSPRNDAKRKRTSEEPASHTEQYVSSNKDDSQGPGGPSPVRHGSPVGPDSKRPKTTTTEVLFKAEPTASPPRLHGLPPMLWKRIFSLLPPVFLGRLLRVSRDFNSLLTPNAAAEDISSSLAPLSSQSVWLASRQRYASGLPQALPGQSELEMWRLIRGNSCQLCKQQKPLLSTSSLSDEWVAPTEDVLRVFWPFGVRCCKRCLQEHIEQESSLLFSSSVPSFLLSAMPSIFLCKDQHYVHSYTVKNSAHPADVQLLKVFYKPLVEQVKTKLHRLTADDSGSAKAWIEKLEKENERRTERVLKWEQWEAKGGLKKVNVRPGARRTPAIKHVEKQPNRLSKSPKADVASQSHELPKTNVSQISTVRDSNGLMYSSMASHEPTYNTVPPGSESMQPTANPNPSGFPNPTPYNPPFDFSNSAPHRPERNLRNVTEAKAERRAEIEKRCMELDPPIPTNILCHMDSFQAALQIPQPLTEPAWELLKPRLLDQREEAENYERDRLAQEKAMQDSLREQAQQATLIQEDSDSKDRAWDASQAPIRDRLSIYADEQIRNRWSNGSGVHKETCATFAADVLLYVKRRFDEDYRHFTGSTATAPADGSPNVPAESSLILENMKWVFDNKIRPLTEPYQREVFLCSICEGSSKYYGFEAVIQHYAAKHTTTLSQGSVVVHWRAKWPDQAPFHPNPGLAKSPYSLSTSNSYAPHSITPAPVPYQVAQVAPFLEHAIPWMQNFTGAQTTPQPEPTYPGFAPVHYGNPAPSPYQSQYSAPSSSAAPLNNQYHVPNPGPQYPAPPYGSSPAQTIQAQVQWPQYSPPMTTVPQASLPATQANQAQMNDMAKHAREIWFAIGGVRDMPASVRIYVVIQNVAMRLASSYSDEFSLTMFLDGLNQNAQMRPVRSLNGLMCRTCKARESQHAHESQPHRSESSSDRKQYTLPLLLNHFKSLHLEGVKHSNGDSRTEPMQLEWKRDMIELPEASVLLSLINAHGMDNAKLALISQAFLGVFPNPLPKAGMYKTVTHTMGVSRSFRQQNSQQFLASAGGTWDAQASNRSREGVSPARSNTSRSDRRSRSSTRDWQPPRDDEYDPHRPAYLGKVMDSHRASEPKRSSPAAGRNSEPGPDDYDPNQPMIDYNISQRSSRPHRRPPKIEVVEADQFLDQLQPQIEQARGQYSGDPPKPARFEEPYPSSGGSRHRGTARSYETQEAYDGRDPYEPPGSTVSSHVPEPHLRRSPHERPSSGRRRAEWVAYVSPGTHLPSPHDPQRNEPIDVSRESAPQPAVRYVTESHPSGYYSQREHHSAHVHYVYHPNASHGQETAAHDRDRPRAVEYIPVEEYREARYAHPSPPGPPNARSYVEGRSPEALRRRIEGDSYDEMGYISRTGRSEPEARVVYREYR